MIMSFVARPGLEWNDLRYGKDKTKNCSVAFFTFHRDVTVVEFDNIFDNFCPEAGSFFFGA